MLSLINPNHVQLTQPVNFSDIVEDIRALSEHVDDWRHSRLSSDDSFVDITSAAFPMYVPVADYIGSLRINQLEEFEALEERGGINLVKFDLLRGIIITAKFAATFNAKYFEKLKAVRNKHPELNSILDPILYSYPNEAAGDEPTGELVMFYDTKEVKVAGLVLPSYEDQEKIQFYEIIPLGKALSFLELVHDFAGIATDNDNRPLNY